MNSPIEHIIQQATGASASVRGAVIQSLWSGYGEIVRYALTGTDISSVIVKHVKFPNHFSHPRGWNNDFSHQRKVKSYEVEQAWYATWAKTCTKDCRVPKAYATKTIGDEHIMVLEDLDTVGFPIRKEQLDFSDIHACLTWLAHFHAQFMGTKAQDLWKVGSYWHLGTRPDELAAMQDDNLRKAAPWIDRLLKHASYQTLIHGDAKLANFCFSKPAGKVAAVDFQYIGHGCGMKDVAYFLGSCLDDNQQEEHQNALLRVYFKQLKQALSISQPSMDGEAVEKEWRMLMPYAQADFYRFLVGWMPNHWKINRYNQHITQKVLKTLPCSVLE